LDDGTSPHDIRLDWQFDSETGTTSTRQQFDAAAVGLNDFA
jgi:hypothetical protein